MAKGHAELLPLLTLAPQAATKIVRTFNARHDSDPHCAVFRQPTLTDATAQGTDLIGTNVSANRVSAAKLTKNFMHEGRLHVQGASAGA